MVWSWTDLRPGCQADKHVTLQPVSTLHRSLTGETLKKAQLENTHNLFFKESPYHMVLCSIYHGIYLSIWGKEFMSQEIICDSFSTTTSCRKAAVTQRLRHQQQKQHLSRDNENLSVSSPQTLMLWSQLLAVTRTEGDRRWRARILRELLWIVELHGNQVNISYMGIRLILKLDNWTGFVSQTETVHTNKVVRTWREWEFFCSRAYETTVPARTQRPTALQLR